MNNKVWIVLDPTVGCAMSEIMYEATATELARQACGAGLAEFERQRPRLHLSKDGAVSDVRARLESAVGRLSSLLGDKPPQKEPEVHTGAIAIMFNHLVSYLSTQPSDVVIGTLNSFMTTDLASALRLGENEPFLKLVGELRANISGWIPDQGDHGDR